jgi:hypothetical protein
MLDSLGNVQLCFWRLHSGKYSVRNYILKENCTVLYTLKAFCYVRFGWLNISPLLLVPN